MTTIAPGACPPLVASAGITEFAIKSTQPYGDFAGGKYVRIEAEARGELSPQEAIPGLDKAAKNARGLVEYRTPVTMIVPESPHTGNGNLLVGKAYTAMLDLKPGDEFEIKLGRKQIRLIPAGSSEDDED